MFRIGRLEHAKIEGQFSDFAVALTTDLRAVETMGVALDALRSRVRTQELLGRTNPGSLRVCLIPFVFTFSRRFAA